MRQPGTRIRLLGGNKEEGGGSTTALCRTAWEVGRAALPCYRTRFSKHQITRPCIGGVLADAEFGSERNHTDTRQWLKARSVIVTQGGEKTWRLGGVRAEMRGAFPRKLYRRHGPIETVFVSVKRKLTRPIARSGRRCAKRCCSACVSTCTD